VNSRFSFKKITLMPSLLGSVPWSQLKTPAVISSISL